MTHRLTPTDKSKERTLDELIHDLREEFEFVDADRESGSDHVGDMIVTLLRILKGFDRWKEPPQYAADIRSAIGRLEELRHEAALMVVGDGQSDEDGLISFNLIPGEEIIVGYSGHRHEEMGSKVTERVAKVLGFRLECE